VKKKPEKLPAVNGGKDVTKGDDAMAQGSQKGKSKKRVGVLLTSEGPELFGQGDTKKRHLGSCQRGRVGW